MYQLDEKVIQQLALEFLKKYYHKHNQSSFVHARMEEPTKAQKRADGCIVIRQGPSKALVAVVEAKSHSTISDLTATTDDQKIGYEAYFFGTATLALLTGIAWHFGLKKWINSFSTMAMMLILTLLILFGREILKKLFPSRYKTPGVLKQLKQYPANEAWIAIGKNSITNPNTFRTLKKKCQQSGIGILIVHLNTQVKIHLKPKFKPSGLGGDFLREYKHEKQIRQELEKNKRSVLWFSLLTPSQKSWHSQKFLIALLFVLGLWLPIPKKSITPQRVWSERKETSEASFEPITAEEFQDALPKEKQLKDCLTWGYPLDEDHFDGPKYIVLDALFDHETEAMTRVKLLEKAGMDHFGYIWLPCFENNLSVEKFCVYVYNPRSDKFKADENLDRYKNWASYKKFAIQNPMVIWVDRLE